MYYIFIICLTYGLMMGNALRYELLIRCPLVTPTPCAFIILQQETGYGIPSRVRGCKY